MSSQFNSINTKKEKQEAKALMVCRLFASVCCDRCTTSSLHSLCLEVVDWQPKIPRYLFAFSPADSDWQILQPSPRCAIFTTARGLLARLVPCLLTLVQECPSSAFACRPQDLHRIPAPLQTLHFTDVLAVAAQGFCSWGNIIDSQHIQVLPDVAPVSCGGGDGCTNGNCVVLTDITSFVKTGVSNVTGYICTLQ